MKLYRAKVPVAARDIVQQLLSAGDIEVTSRDEAEADIQSVLNEYLRLEREVVDQTKDLLEKRNLPHGQFGRVRRMVADQKGLSSGDDSVIWICNQILETFMESNFIEEIFASDSDMRRKMRDILVRHMMVDDELDEEVRTRIKNLQEGTSQWDIEYQKALQQIKRKRGIDD